MNVRALSERGLLVAGQRDQLRALPFQVRQQRDQLVGFAGIRQQEHDIVGGDHAEVAMARLGGVHEEGGCARRGKRRGELARNVTRLADADHDHAPATIEQRPRGGKERCAELRLQRANGFGFRCEHVAAQRQRALGIESAHVRRGLNDVARTCVEVYPKRMPEAPGEPRAVLHWPDVADAATDPASACGDGRRDHHLPTGSPAADPRLRGGRHRGRAARDRHRARQRRRAQISPSSGSCS